MTATTRPTWLITGGAGYIGGHLVRVLVDAGYHAVVLDDLSTGRVERLPHTVPLVTGRVQDTALLERTIRAHAVTGIVHLAGKKAADESVREPLDYYDANTRGTASVLTAMRRTDVRRLVFSSTAAVYGTPHTPTVTESSTTAPLNPYGTSKLVAEWMIRDLANCTALAAINLRYFNVVGAATTALADRGTSNLIPRTFAALDRGVAATVFGADYPTHDGTCVRDYIHVSDLAEAHLAAIRAIEREHQPVGTRTYNVGTGRGASVIEVLRAVRDITGITRTWRVTERRAGDPASVVADPSLINRELGWRASYDLTDMIESAWRAWRNTSAPTLSQAKPSPIEPPTIDSATNDLVIMG